MARWRWPTCCGITRTARTATPASSIIEDAEHAADRITHETVQLLHTTFVTPFDRDDIHRLISRMDDVLDLIQDTAESLVLYDIQKVTPEATQLAELVLRCAEHVQSAVGLMASMADAPPSSRSARKSTSSSPRPTRSCAARSPSCSATKATCAR